MSFNEELLDDYIDILSGFAFKTKDFVDKGVPIIKIKNISPPCVTLDDLTYVSNEVAEKQKKFILSYDDVLIAMTGSHINQWASVVGRVARVKYYDSTLLNQRVGKITIKDNAEADINYIYYYLSQDTVKIELATKAGGAANQANISPAHIKGLSFPCPDLATQNKIGNILKSYDDLIENNQKQIKLLEEAAKRLYKEWFIDLHFPGYEDVEIVDGVPDGWTKDRAECFFKITIGKTPPRAEKQWFVNGNDGIPWISISDMGNAGVFTFKTSEGLTEEAIKKHKMKIVPSGTIFVSFKLTVGRVAIATTEMCTNEAIAHFYVNDSLQAYTYCYLSNFEYDTLGNTSSISKAVNSKIIKAMPFIMPSQGIVEKFSAIVSPILSEIKVNQKMCNYLSEARDRLLPKLMSGEIKV